MIKFVLARLQQLRKRAALTPEQAEHLAHVKFPCC